MLAVLDHYGSRARRGAAARQRRRARLPGRQGRLRDGRRRPRRGAVLQRRSPVALLRRRALLPRPHPGPPAITSPRRAATCARSSSRPTRTASPSSSTDATSRSRTWPTWRSAGSPTSRASTTTPTTSISACPSDSDRLPDALFEASWSMFQKGEYEAARRVPRGVRPQLPGVAAGARRDAAARDDRPQVVRVRQRARDAGQVRPGLRADRGAGRGAAQGSGQARRRSTGACSARHRSPRRTIRSPIC